jgi:hypothetical protein
LAQISAEEVPGSKRLIQAVELMRTGNLALGFLPEGGGAPL